MYKPTNDISSAYGKIGGAAQTRRGGAVLHHVTMSYDIDTRKMLEVLRIGKEKLSDKGTASAAKRVTPLRQQTALPRQAIIDRFIDTFADCYGLERGDLEEHERLAAERLVEEKFGTTGWTYLLP
ncbi:MAG TPA: hypothetical protein VF168_07760 [Trueperaceae bacterium]